MTASGVTPPTGVYETIIYAENVAATAAFYRDVIGLTPIEEPGELGAFFRLADGAMLLVFDPRHSSVPGRAVPSHGALGAGHVAFAIRADELSAWRERLRQHDVELELERHDPTGTGQLYFRDPAGNSVELVEGDIWE